MLDLSGAAAAPSRLPHHVLRARLLLVVRQLHARPRLLPGRLVLRGRHDRRLRRRRQRLRHAPRAGRPAPPAPTSARRGSTTPAATRRTPSRSPTPRLHRRPRPLAEQPVRGRHRPAAARCRGPASPRSTRPTACRSRWNPDPHPRRRASSTSWPPRDGLWVASRHRPDRRLPTTTAGSPCCRSPDRPSRPSSTPTLPDDIYLGGARRRRHGPERALPRQRRRRRAVRPPTRHRLGRGRRRLAEPVPQQRRTPRRLHRGRRRRLDRAGRARRAAFRHRALGRRRRPRADLELPGRRRRSRSRCGSTSPTGRSAPSQVGQRIFDVDVDGTRVLDDFDIVADGGRQHRHDAVLRRHQ